MKVILTAAVALLLLIGAATASADSSTTTFSDPPFAVGDGKAFIDGKDGWTQHGNYDTGIVANGIDGQSFRVSNSFVSENMSDMPFSNPVQAAGEAETNKVLISEFTFLSFTPDQLQRGLNMSISQTDSLGARMSYVRLEDEIDGVRVFFNDSPNQYSAEFNDRWIATLDRKVPHTIRIESKFVPGNDNDVVRVYIDNAPKACGTTWENYYRYTEMMQSKEDSETPYVLPSDRLMWRLRTSVSADAGTDHSTTPPTPWPSVEGQGFLFDNVTNTSQVEGGPEGCPLPVGPAGPGWRQWHCRSSWSSRPDDHHRRVGRWAEADRQHAACHSRPAAEGRALAERPRDPAQQAPAGSCSARHR